MGSVQYPWWPYVQSMIRNYPERMQRAQSLNRVEKMEFDAVNDAIQKTKAKEDGEERIKLIRRAYWIHNQKTMEGVAMELYISRATAFRWSADFMMLVAECFGIYDPE